MGTRGLSLVALALIAAGCGPAASSPPAAPPVASANDPRAKLPKGVVPVLDRSLAMDDLRQIGVFYLAPGAERGPSRLEDMRDLKLQGPKLYQALQDGRYVLFWGANPNAAAAGQTVLGYEKDAPGQGGAVLMLDGTTRIMTAQEFNAATKAGQ